jgi:predicted hydrolase (HD superfamily)
MKTMSREEALALVRAHVSKESNVKHMVAVGAVMCQLAQHLGEDGMYWEITGILHDIDFELCHGMSDHTIKAKELLKGHVDQVIIEAIMAHNHEHTNIKPDTPLKKGLIACDAVSGLVLACALVMPSGKLADVKMESVAKKYRTKDFAKGVDRGRIMTCEELGVPLADFLGIAVEGMKKHSAELGL